MKIKEVSRQTGLTERTIRFYEQAGLISPASRLQNGKKFRDYDDCDLAALEHIAALRRAMFTLDEIRRMQVSPDQIGPILETYKARMELLAQEAVVLAGAAKKLGASDLSDYQTLADALEDAARLISHPSREIAPHFGRFDPERRSAAEERKLRKEGQKACQNQNAALMMQAMADANQRGVVADRSEIAGVNLPVNQRMAVVRGLLDEFSKE